MAAKNILIVDDERFVTDALEGFFHSKGYGIFKAEDGQACLNIIKKEKLDLVLLDIRLPKIDGVEILRLLRRDYPQLKVIVMTAYDMEYKTTVDGIGCEAFFVKPLLIDELTRKVEELLSQEKNSPQTGEQRTKVMPQPSMKAPVGIPEEMLPKARILIVSPRNLISDLLKDYLTSKELCNGIYEVAGNALEELELIKKFQPDIILLDIALVGMLGEFGLTLMKMPKAPKEVILFGDPAAKWEEAETLIKRGVKFIEMPSDLHDRTYSIKDTIERLNNAVREVCAKYYLFDKKEAD